MAKIVIDGTRTQTIRTILLAAFAAVAVALLGALGIHKLKSSGLALDLPGKLGANISQTANGFTYSQSERGHTVFTIHASRITQFKGDEADLHEVSITLYGPEGSHRKDHISGADFLYNKTTGEISAQGKVVIDMAALGPSADGAPDTIHVETSGLRYNQKTGRAFTAEPLAFSVPRANGKAVGGAYDSRTGVLVLENAIELHAMENGVSAATFATHAEVSRDSHAAYLLNVHSTFNGTEMAADQAILHFRPDGTLQHLDAENHVNILTGEGSHLHATNASVDLNAHSEPLTAYAGGGVNYHSGSQELEMHGNAVESTMSFAPGPEGKQQLRHAQFRNAVSFVLQQNSLAGDPRGLATREITASKIDVDFIPGANGRSLAETASAQGMAKIDLHDLPFGEPQRHTAIYAEQLTANLMDGHELQQLKGSGGTKVVDYAPDGSTDTSSGDTLRINFLPESKANERTTSSKGATPKTQSAVVDTAEQSGRITLVAQPARDAKTSTGVPQQPFYAEAENAVYHAGDATLRLTGDPAHPPRVHNAGLSLTANEVGMERNSGVATAQGDVRGTYLQQPANKQQPGAPSLGGTGAVHAAGASATFSRVTSIATFLGNPQVPARLWQGTNAVTAPTIELGRQNGTLDARAPADAHGAVHAVFFAPGEQGGGVTRVTADSFSYADASRIGTFKGQVLAQQPGGTVRADMAQLFLTEAAASQPSRLDRLLASGHVTLAQPGRRGSGEKLVYTASDSSYVLTGGPARASDAEHGSILGAEFLFKSGENSVQVLGQDAVGAVHRTVTDTRTPN